jgi:hypothetical protein
MFCICVFVIYMYEFCIHGFSINVLWFNVHCNFVFSNMMFVYFVYVNVNVCVLCVLCVFCVCVLCVFLFCVCFVCLCECVCV